jgi:organic radical activating enzyme
MKVLEVYKCFQGEGVRIGEASVLCRFFGCNLDCVWCDTQYAINPFFREAFGGPKVLDVPAGALANELLTFDLPVILTGGEPTLQPELPLLTNLLVHTGTFVTIETNATNYLGDKDLGVRSPRRVLWSLSPKLPGAQSGSLNTDVIAKFCHRWEPCDVQLKFVVTDVTDWMVLRELLQSPMLPNPLENTIILQPDGRLLTAGVPTYRAALLWLESLATSLTGYNVRVLPQLHALIHGPKVRLV